MFENFINAIEPFAIGMIALAGASLAGWVSFSNKYTVGLATFACAILLVVSHIIKQIKIKQG